MNRLVIGLKALRGRLSSASLPALPERLRGGSIERSVEYLKNVKNDYKQVFVDTTHECRDRPLKACIYGSIVSFLGYCLATNPDERDLRQQLLDCQNLLSTVPKSILNTNSCDYVLGVNQLVNEKLLNYQSFGFFSVLFVTDYPMDCRLYHNNCHYLGPTLVSYVRDRVVDIGFVGKYRNLDTKMIDYDINANEWTQPSTQS